MRVKSEFRALHQTLQEEENCMLDQLRREEEEELEKVRRHLEATEQAMKELENNIKLLQQSNTTLAEVKASQSQIFSIQVFPCS